MRIPITCISYDVAVFVRVSFGLYKSRKGMYTNCNDDCIYCRYSISGNLTSLPSQIIDIYRPV